MKTRIAFLSLTFMLAISVSGQNSTNTVLGSANSSTKISKAEKDLGLESTTTISAVLQKSLDVEKAKVGDQVVLKTTKAVKQNGEIIIEKGAKLIGRVTEVQRTNKMTADSKMSVLFDTLVQDGSSIPVNVNILAIANAATRAAASNDLFAESSASSTTSARTTSSANSGSLLGGVTNTVGSVVNTAGNTIGSTVNTVGNTAGSAVGNVARPITGLQIMNSTEASANGSSTLSLSGGNLKLEQGTQFQLAVSSSSNVSTAKQSDQK